MPNRNARWLTRRNSDVESSSPPPPRRNAAKRKPREEDWRCRFCTAQDPHFHVYHDRKGNTCPRCGGHKGRCFGGKVIVAEEHERQDLCGAHNSQELCRGSAWHKYLRRDRAAARRRPRAAQDLAPRQEQRDRLLPVTPHGPLPPMSNRDERRLVEAARTLLRSQSRPLNYSDETAGRSGPSCECTELRRKLQLLEEQNIQLRQAAEYRAMVQIYGDTHDKTVAARKAMEERSKFQGYEPIIDVHQGRQAALHTPADAAASTPQGQHIAAQHGKLGAPGDNAAGLHIMSPVTQTDYTVFSNLGRIDVIRTVVAR